MKLPNILIIICAIILTIGFWFVGFQVVGNMHYMSPDDPNNPGHYGKLYITNEVKWIADSIVDSDDSPHEMTVKFMEWTQENIKFEPAPPRPPHPDAIIKSGVGQCGDYVIVVSSFLATQDVPSRVISLYFPTNGHVVIEVYYNESWHMYDPSFAAYWVNDNNVLSFEELQNGGARDAVLVCDSNGMGLAFIFPDTYETANPAGEIGPEHPMWWPLSIDANVGEYIVPEIGLYDAGSRQIGASYINNFHNWTITNLTVGKEYSFIIYPKYMYGNDTFTLHVNETGDYIINKPSRIVADFTTADVDMPPVYINFTAHGEVESLHLWHDYRGEEYVVMTVKRYEVVENGV